ncbi:tetratricopeptide repeat protein [Sungkyunkwania multivorans]|uniref:Tetratricopeptide repeat protein n=1 Tax=Sungkyunkwania multivorans TaxID=1173618 RepID=A0ABW3CTR0_9FLAO
MKASVLFIFLFSCIFGSASGQSDILAKQYFNKGEFEKAAASYEKLYETNPRRIDYLESLISSWQQLEEYEKANRLLQSKTRQAVYPPQILVQIGYNYQLQDSMAKANEFFNKAMDKIRENPNFTSAVGNTFQKYSLLDKALLAYNEGMRLMPRLNYDVQVARIYGEQGDVEKMFESYLNLILRNQAYRPTVLRNINSFVSDDPDNENNVFFRKALLKRLQNNPDLIWNELLSWLFVQQRQYDKAFRQEMAIYNRSDEATLERIIDLGREALEYDKAVAEEIFQYLIENTLDAETKIWAYEHLLELQIAEANTKDHQDIEKQFAMLFENFGKGEQTVGLQIQYAKFLTFGQGETQNGITLLQEAIDTPMARYQKAKLKMALADILVYDEKFNQALIYYSQIQKSLKNDVIGQQARFKVAQTSYFKGDFEWAETQCKVLKSSTSQLIANDALELKLLISDNAFQDSTLTALKIYAKADLLAYQKRNKEAIALLDEILQNHKGEKIEDEALLKQGKLLEKSGDFDKARLNYQKIVEFYPTDILADDAHFALAELFVNHLGEPEKAMPHYEKIIFDHPDSIFFVEARKKYRRLRGDAVN